jgi:4-alpha-glucanotransferase
VPHTYLLLSSAVSSVQPHLFRMDKSTGSPPDFFDPNGQNWGFPTYNWEAMAEEGYAWCAAFRE